MSVILVGHGPSILMEEMGHLIDQYDTVVRIKRCHEMLKDPEHFGTKTDIVGGSLTIAGGLRDLPAEQFWIYNDSRHENVSDDIYHNVKKLMAGKAIINKTLCDKWDERYRELKRQSIIQFDPSTSKSGSSDAHGENHLSQGFKTILFAAHYLEEPELTLVGFDNIYTGQFTWSVTRGPDWTNYPKHRWDIEKQMLEEVKQEYGCRIGFLLPDIPEEDEHETQE